MVACVREVVHRSNIPTAILINCSLCDPPGPGFAVFSLRLPCTGFPATTCYASLAGDNCKVAAKVGRDCCESTAVCGPDLFVATVIDWAGCVVAIRNLLWVLREPIHVFPTIAPVAVRDCRSRGLKWGTLLCRRIVGKMPWFHHSNSDLPKTPTPCFVPRSLNFHRVRVPANFRAITIFLLVHIGCHGCLHFFFLN